jgi:hypothetical protein
VNFLHLLIHITICRLIIDSLLLLILTVITANAAVNAILERRKFLETPADDSDSSDSDNEDWK